MARTVVDLGECRACGTRLPSFRLLAEGLSVVPSLVMLRKCNGCDGGWVPVNLADVSLDPSALPDKVT